MLLERYIENLRKQVEASRSNEAEAKARRLHPASRLECNTPLETQIEQLMAALPPAQRERSWTIAELVPRLRGRYNDRPHPADVGLALRRLGWVRTRDWSREGEGRRTWRRQED